MAKKSKKKDILYKRCGFLLVLDFQECKVLLACNGKIEDIDMKTGKAKIGSIHVKDTQIQCWGVTDTISLDINELKLATDISTDTKNIWNELLEAYVRISDDD